MRITPEFLTEANRELSNLLSQQVPEETTRRFLEWVNHKSVSAPKTLHQSIIRIYTNWYEGRYGQKYLFAAGKDGKAAQKLATFGATTLEVWHYAELASRGDMSSLANRRWLAAQVVTLSGLAAQWNAIRSLYPAPANPNAPASTSTW